jgi:uncharacterized membrane protein YoaK (UPF0700 family)
MKPPDASVDNLLTILAILLGVLAHWLQTDKLPQWVNLLIAGVATILLAVIATWETGFSGNISQDLLQIVTTWVIFIYQLINLLMEARKTSSPLPAAIARPRPASHQSIEESE